MTDAPYKLFRGRPVKDAAWNALIAQAPFVVENDEDEEQVLLEIVRVEGHLPRGCSKWSKSVKHYCQMYLAGRQRHIAKGTLYQCAKFYDYALIFFDKYRVRKAVTNFNFDRADDESEMAAAPAIGEYLSTLEKYLLESGALALPESPEKKAEAAKEKQRTREHKRTVAGTIETWMEEFQPHIFDIADRVEEVNRKLDALSSEIVALKLVIKSKNDL